jgi:hypothetical protein
VEKGRQETAEETLYAIQTERPSASESDLMKYKQLKSALP